MNCIEIGKELLLLSRCLSVKFRFNFNVQKSTLKNKYSKKRKIILTIIKITIIIQFKSMYVQVLVVRSVSGAYMNLVN